MLYYSVSALLYLSTFLLQASFTHIFTQALMDASGVHYNPQGNFNMQFGRARYEATEQ